MKKWLISFSLFLVLGFVFSCSNKTRYVVGSENDIIASNQTQRERNIDLGWGFLRDSVAGAEAITLDDSKWRIVDLPHDFSIEDLAGKDSDDQIGPFTKKSESGASTGHVLGGTGWYRKRITLPSADKGKIIKIHFDGAYMETDVWLNGVHIGYHPNGYTPFYYDLTPYLKPSGQENIIAVRVKNIGKNSRWYSGSGIYRHVWLTATNPVHIDTWGVTVATPEVNPQQASVKLNIKLRNRLAAPQQVSIVTRLLDANGNIAAEHQPTFLRIEPNANSEIKETIKLTAPIIWSLEAPHLYKAVVSVLVKGKVVDQYIQSFGVRIIAFSAEEGFKLNGKKVLLKGANIHHDNGLLGAAAIGRAEERRVELLKANGFNAIRTSHNPPSEEFLNACDRLGMLVIDEAFDMWQHPKNPQDYHQFFDKWSRKDLEAIILRDRNHPSVIMWSIGNEIYERADSSGIRIAKELSELCHQLDSTRPVTAGVCDFWDHPGRTWADTAPAFQYLDVHGYNYAWKEYVTDHQKYPNRIMVGTETFPNETYENWQQAKQHAWVLGDFVWTGIDHLGESGIGHTVQDKEATGLMPWPWYVNWSGDIDLLGFKKPQSFYRDVVWEQSKLEVAVQVPITAGKKVNISKWGWPDELQSWTWPGEEGKKLNVVVYSSAQVIRLELNGKVVGEKQILPQDKLIASFEVPYAPGELKAVALTNGVQEASKILKSVGKPVALRLKPDRTKINASRNDLSFVVIEAIDAQGEVVPYAAVNVKLTVIGNGELTASGTANPNDMKSFRKSNLLTFQGRAMAVLRPYAKNGNLNLVAEADGMKPVTVTIQVEGSTTGE